MAVVTDMSPLRDPMRRAREVAEELTRAGDGTPLFQVQLVQYEQGPTHLPLLFHRCTTRWRWQKGQEICLTHASSFFGLLVPSRSCASCLALICRHSCVASRIMASC